MNITDVEDKIIRESQKGLDPGTSNEGRHRAMRAFTDEYASAFLEDCASLGILPPTYTPRATEYIPQMIRLIGDLEAKGLAYPREGSVYYRIAGLPHYGCLAHLDREGMKAGVSVDTDEYERDSVQDFVLWKAAKEGEPWWESPWGPGRPGWHIECSAMGMELLGERVDIHSGGVDLVFPHHENEIAQSEGALGHRWVNTWVHGEFLLVEGEKMSKSLGNFFTLRDLAAKGVDPKAFRFTIQSSHYRKVLNFSFEGLRASENALKRIRQFRKRMEGEGAPGQGAWKEAIDPRARVEQARSSFWAAMADDLNSPEALAALFTLISDINAQDDRVALTPEERGAVLAFLDETDAIFGCWPHQEENLDEGVEALIRQRMDAKAARNWAEADRIRGELKAMGIVLEDRKDGTVSWRRA
jgi:cysteinyl-tRNA synthetase